MVWEEPRQGTFGHDCVPVQQLTTLVGPGVGPWPWFVIWSSLWKWRARGIRTLGEHGMLFRKNFCLWQTEDSETEAQWVDRSYHPTVVSKGSAINHDPESGLLSEYCGHSTQMCFLLILLLAGSVLPWLGPSSCSCGWVRHHASPLQRS